MLALAAVTYLGSLLGAGLARLRPNDAAAQLDSLPSANANAIATANAAASITVDARPELQSQSQLNSPSLGAHDPATHDSSPRNGDVDGRFAQVAANADAQVGNSDDDAPPRLQLDKPANNLASGDHPFLGFTMNLHYTDDLAACIVAIDEMAAAGVTHLQILTPAFQRDGADDQVRLIAGQGRGPTRSQLLAVLHYARQKQMATALLPVVLFTHPRGNEWRGKISPEYWDQWWSSYRLVMRWFVSVANEAGVDWLAVGSELLSTESQTAQWQSLITDLRSRFAGRGLYYSTNWDHYHHPQFWADVDLIGVNGYWSLTQHAAGDIATDAELSARWAEIRTQLQAFAVDQGRPLLLTEIGYPALPWALDKPWNYVASKSQAASPQEQTRGFAAFLHVWRNDLLGVSPAASKVAKRASPTSPRPRWFAGAFIYDWDPFPAPPETDTGYSIRDRPAGALVNAMLTELRELQATRREARDVSPPPSPSGAQPTPISPTSAP